MQAPKSAMSSSMLIILLFSSTSLFSSINVTFFRFLCSYILNVSITNHYPQHQYSATFFFCQLFQFTPPLRSSCSWTSSSSPPHPPDHVNDGCVWSPDCSDASKFIFPSSPSGPQITPPTKMILMMMMMVKRRRKTFSKERSASSDISSFLVSQLKGNIPEKDNSMNKHEKIPFFNLYVIHHRVIHHPVMWLHCGVEGSQCLV